MGGPPSGGAGARGPGGMDMGPSGAMDGFGGGRVATPPYGPSAGGKQLL